MIRSISLEIASEEKKRSECDQKRLKEEINFWQKAFENSKSVEYRSLAISNLNDLMAERDDYLGKKGEYFSNRTRSKWYQEGERSTKYFLNLQRSKVKQSEMRELIVDGVEINDPRQINEVVESFYKNLYEKGNTKETNQELLNDFTDLSPLDEDRVRFMESQITKNDLSQTLNSCKDSAPGPDGIPYSIIKATWNYYADILLDCWKYSEEVNELTHSHKSSYLRLIPKEGKDPKVLKNWRPITLSNCDFKLITKTLSRKLTSAISETISNSQTAYIPGRQITDNLHLMLHTIEECSSSKIDSMLVSLDAEKAFDSVEHWYIKALLSRLGLTVFTKTFDLLYKNQMVDIILNNTKAGSYNIKNGVKQGDALSCILFIMCIEPLIRRIQNDSDIRSIRLNGDDQFSPKIVAYADDIACMIPADKNCLQKIFTHYEELTNLSGLKLNADKTEIISNCPTRSFKITYLGDIHEISVGEEMKVNGLVLSYNKDITYKKNFGKLFNAMERQLTSWSNRGLSLLGKILIYKTFGLSQILFIGSVISLTKKDESKINELIYRFIWNRDMNKLKAPDRIKRQILKSPIKHLGFGMIDFRDVLRSIRIKTILRIYEKDNHPLNKIIKGNTNTSWINIKTLRDFRPPLSMAIKDINSIWKEYLLNTKDYSRELLHILSNEYVGNLTEYRFRNKRLALNHRHDTIREILTTSWSHAITSKLIKEVCLLIGRWSGTRILVASSEIFKVIPLRDKLVHINKISSNMIRKALMPSSNNEVKNLGLVDTPQLTRLGSLINKLTNVRLKTVMLRVMHGDIYCASRMKKFGMTDNDQCPRCSQEETTEHMILTCGYVKKIWDLISSLTSIPHGTIKTILGLDPKHDKTTLTLNAEIIRQLMAIERPTIDPLVLVQNTIKRLTIVERGITKYQINKFLEAIKPVF